MKKSHDSLLMHVLNNKNINEEIPIMVEKNDLRVEEVERVKRSH